MTHLLSQLFFCNGWQQSQTQVREYSLPCHLLDGNLPAPSLWLPQDLLLGVQGGAVWAKPLG